MLHHRNLSSSDICTRCSSGEETILHCLRDCPISRRIWNSLGFQNSSFFSCSDLELWLRNNSIGLNAPTFLAGLWWNWRARNICCVGNASIHSFKVVAEVSKLVALIVSCFPAWVRTDTPRVCKTDCVVLNVDGSCLGDPGRAGFGGLFRKGDGEWIRGSSGYLGVTNITLAELMAVYHGLKIAREAGYNRLFCYSDSKTVLDLLSKERNSFHCYAAIIANIQDLLVLEWDVSLKHSVREGNFCADFLAKLGSANDEKFSIWESPPPDMQDLLLSDALRVPYPRA
ncbi:hypothetical protein TSUD_333820 [Trifolium subterraneum]|uniref:RNase H type-1 domain-containing protein n=1 Tax=Trifolium subterraneum TaxID=3900 RepID=A0A2Z6NNQ1_TRISU|nr:hypothetical protein TSUD_333820 [Trifolium subterraneum]